MRVSPGSCGGRPSYLRCSAASAPRTGSRQDVKFAELQNARFVAQRMLDDLLLRPPAGITEEQLAANRATCQTEIAEIDDRLQDALAKYLGDRGSLMLTTDSVRTSLPDDAALVEFIKYTTFKFQAIDQESRWGEERYIAFVLHSGAEQPVAMIDLGEAAPIDELIADLSERIEDAKRTGNLANWADLEAEYRQIARPLHKKLFAPIAAKLAGVKRIYLAPDGQLHNLPFEALVDGDGKYLVEQGYTFAYLTSGRDLVRKSDGDPGQGAYVFAAPNYDLPHDARFQLASQAPAIATTHDVTAPPVDAVASTGRAARVREMCVA